MYQSRVAKARWAFAGKFGLGRKFYAIFIYAILSRYLELSRSKHFLGKFGQKSFLLLSETVFFRQEKHYFMVYIAYYTELNWQICNSAQKRGICYKNSKNAPDENFCGHFSPRRKAANFCDKYQLCL